MKQPFTTLRRLLLLAAAWASVGAAWGQTYTPVPLTGFTHDIIANGTGAVSATTTADIDGSAATGGTGYCLMAQDYVGPTGQVPNNTTYPALENNGLITSVLNSAITYQLAPYSSNNALRLYGAAASGTLSFATPSPAAELYVIGTSGNATSVLDITVTFADGTTQVFTGQSIADWFATGQTNVVREKLGRVSRADNTVQYTATPVGPRFYQLKLVLDVANIRKNITGLTFSKPLAAGNTVLLAVTAGTYTVCAAAPTGLTTSATTASGGTTAITSACSGTNIYLSVNGLTAQTGYTYQWQASTNGGTTWTSIAGATAATYTATGQTTATSYRVLVACLFDGAGATAVPSAPVAIGQNAAADCYCIPAAHTSTTTSYTSANTVSLPGDGAVTLANAPGIITSTSTGYVSANYAVYPASSTTTALTIAGSYTLTVNVPAFTRASVWVDYDRNGTFDTNEFVLLRNSSAALYSSVADNLTATITPPTTAVTGLTRLRIRTDYYNNTVINTAAGACSTTQYGEALDYFVTLSPSIACTGTPPAITVTSTANTVCGGTAFTLTAAGVANGVTGISYQWQSSPAGTNTFTNLGTAQTGNTYAVATQTVATDYRVIVTCTASNLSATSNVVAVAQNPFLNCYCTPTYASGGTNDYIARVQLGTLDNNTASAGNVSPYYHDYSAQQTGTGATLAIPALFPGTSTTVSVSFGSDGTQYSGVWFDFNQNGTFETTEYFSLGTNAGASGTSVIPVAVPATATLGQTKMRVRGGNDSALTSAQACGTSSSGFGEAEDYLVNLVAPVACTGTPPAITATASATTACSTASFTLNATGVVAGTTGLTYQWQSAPTGTTTFTNLGTAQTTPGYTVATQTVSSDYRVVVTCTASGQSATSNVVSVARTFLNCYCAVTSTGTNEYIKSVTLPGTPGFTNATNAASTNGTGDFTTNAAFTTTLNQGATYVNGVSVIVRSNNTNSTGGMWIDYDQSGTFDASEFILLGTSSAIATDVTFSATLAVPATALTGQTRVRVRWRNGGFTSADACVTGTTNWYGETEDYLVTIAAPTTCSAPPATVVAAADVANACANSSFNLSTSSVPAALGGFSYQWQSRTGTNAFANITGATTNPYTIASQSVATDYRLVVSCQFGGTPVTSNIVSVGQNSFDQCYCAASSTNICSNYGVITSVAIGTINNPSTCNARDSYSSFTNLSTDVAPGAPITLTLGVASATTTFNYNYGVWIDFNHNGNFDATEFLAGSTAAVSATSTTITLNIPALSASVLSGPTRLRIRTNAGIVSYGFFTAAGGACGAVYNGETEDYTVNILNCTATTAGFSYGTATGFCTTGGTATPTLALATGATAGAFTATPAGLTLNATTGAITTSTSTPGTYTVTNTVATTATTCGSTATTTVTINAAPATPTITPSGTPAGGITLISSAATGNQFYLNGVAVPGATNQIYLVNSGTKNGSYTVTVTNAAGCSATSAPTNVTVTAAITGQAGTALTVAPNPTHDGLLTLELTGYRESVALTISNPLGQRVYESTIVGSALSQKQSLNLSALPSGVYILQARTASGGVEVRRIVRE